MAGVAIPIVLYLLYFQGKFSTLEQYVGQGYQVYGFDIPGVPSAINFKILRNNETNRETVVYNTKKIKF